MPSKYLYPCRIRLEECRTKIHHLYRRAGYKKTGNEVHEDVYPDCESQIEIFLLLKHLMDFGPHCCFYLAEFWFHYNQTFLITYFCSGLLDSDLRTQNETSLFEFKFQAGSSQ